MTALATFVRQHGSRRFTVLILAIGGGLAVPGPVTAALDGSTPMLCSIATVLECDASKCERATTDDADLPNFVRVDVPKKLVTAVPGAKQTTIKFSEYLSERQWGTVREDYSESGDSWHYLAGGKQSGVTYREDHAPS
jgi:hypothetical protein